MARWPRRDDRRVRLSVTSIASPMPVRKLPICQPATAGVVSQASAP